MKRSWPARTVRWRWLPVGVFALLAALLLGSFPAEAQQRKQRRVRPQATPRTQQRAVPRAQQGDFNTPAGQLLDRFGDRAAEALHLNRQQARRMKTVLQTSRRERAVLEVRRHEIRQELSELVRTGAGGQERSGQLLDELLQLQLRVKEVDLVENRSLAEFMDPLQRARLFHLKQRMAQRALELRRPDQRR